MSRELPVISLWKPWSYFVAFGWKTIETRLHNKFKSLEGREIAIHSTQKWDKNWENLSYLYLSEDKMKEVKSWYPLKTSEIIATAYVKEFKPLDVNDSKEALIDCDRAYGRYGLVLDNIKQILPIPVKGKQGIWYYKFDQ